MRFLLMLLFLPVTATAQIALGGKISSDKPAATIGDFHNFNLTGADIWGLDRYGIGRGQFEVASNRVWISGDNRSGAFLSSKDGLKLGLEPFSGMVGYLGRPAYQWEPAVSVGFKETTKDFGFYAGPRVGYSYNKTWNSSFTGAVVQVQAPTFGITYWGDDYQRSSQLRIYNLNLFNRYSIEKRFEHGDDITMFSVRFDL